MSPSRCKVADVASPEDDDSPASSTVLQRKRQHFDNKASARRVTAVACLACQRRKSKCDGGRPTCGACHQRVAACSYETADGLTRLADLKHKNGLLLSRVSNLERVFAKLRSEDDVEATQTLARLRLGDEISQILDLVEEPRSDFGSAMSKHEWVFKSKKPECTNLSYLPLSSTWRSFSPISQGSLQSPTTSMAHPIEQSHRNDSQLRATAIAQPQWIVPFSDIKSMTPVKPSTSLWCSDAEGYRRASTSPAHLVMLSNTVLAPGTDLDAMSGSGESIKSAQANRETHTSYSNQDSEKIQTSRSSQDMSRLDEKHTARRICDEKRHSSMASAIDVVSPEQHVDMSLLMTLQPAFSGPGKMSDGSIPLWAILPKHKYDEHPINAAIAGFMFEKRSMIRRGFPPASFMGLTPALDCLFDDKSFAVADDLSRWAVTLGVTFFRFGLLQAVTAHFAWYLMRWMIMPTPETYQAVPSWMRPTPDQLLVPHTIATDFLHRPQFRDAVLRSSGMQENSCWIEELHNMVDCNWPHSIEAGLARDGETGCLSLNPLLRDHVENMENWSISSRLRAFMPNADIYFHLRHQGG